MTAQPRPLKRFGQNFLKNTVLAEKIIEAVGIEESDVVVEIGAGPGVLTRFIAEKQCRKKIALEIDRRRVESLRQEFHGRVEIIETDVLQFSFASVAEKYSGRVKVVGNIPYNITGPILFKILDDYHSVSTAVLMVQKEVGQRITAAPGNKTYGIISVLAAANARPERIMDVGRKNFWPVPGVDSTVIRLADIDRDNRIENYELFRDIVRKTFNMRRKMLQNSLKSVCSTEILPRLKSVSLRARPEELSYDDFRSLANEIYSMQKEQAKPL